MPVLGGHCQSALRPGRHARLLLVRVRPQDHRQGPSCFLGPGRFVGLADLLFKSAPEEQSTETQDDLSARHSDNHD